MSSSSVSSVNKYLLSSTGPYVPVPPPTYTLLQSNVAFPAGYTGLTTQMNGITTTDRRITFTPTGTGSWRNQPHELLCSSYLNWAGTMYGIQDIFDGLTTNTSFWAGHFNGPNALVNYLDGVNMGHFAGASYNSSGVYIGGGVVNGIDNFFTTVYNSGAASGEYIQFKFPVYVSLKSFDIMCRNGQPLSGPKDVVIVGSNDGSTWSLIVSVAYSTYTNGVYLTKVFAASDKYLYIRAVILKTRMSGVAIGELKFTFDAYDIV
jgi:hypothetical protein